MTVPPYHAYQFRRTAADKADRLHPFDCDCPLCVPGPLKAAIVMAVLSLVGVAVLVLW